MIGVFLVAQAAGAPGPPPAGPPTSVHTSFYGGGPSTGGKIALSWVNGDATAFTETGVVEDGSPDEPASSFHSVGAGTTYYETGLGFQTDDAIARQFWVRHLKNSSYSAWVKAT